MSRLGGHSRGAGARTQSEDPCAGAARPWAKEELLWLRVLKSPHEHLRRCDWAFLEERLARSRPEIRRKLIELGLIEYGRRYEVDETFFDSWSPATAWVLGLLLSDGHLPRTAPAIHFSSTDRELVEKVRSCLRSTHPIKQTDGGVGHRGSRPVFVLTIVRRRLRTAVDRLVPGRLKSERVRLPDVPLECLGHLVRGYFEGDGSIYFDEPRSNLHVQISGLTAFIEDLRVRLAIAGVADGGFVYRCPQARDTSTLHINGAMAFRLADYLYRDVPDALVLTRKRAVYLRCREWRARRGLLDEARG